MTLIKLFRMYLGKLWEQIRYNIRMNNLTDLLEQVIDRDTFLNFVAALMRDRKQEATKAEWQNDTIEQYLESGLAWAKTTDMGKTQGLNQDNLWRVFAEFLYLGKIYE